MSIRLLCCGALVLGAALFGTSCGPTAEASQQANTLVEDQSKGAFCGGFAGIACAEGYVCVDDPSDDCDPAQGGADCGGICQKNKKPGCDDPARTYVSRDPEQCAVIRFFCEDPNTVPFSDECGCGCEPAPR
jgi:hypothetical protein